ncbi:hypothetical protein BU26DRAFT_568222 [Trematosphaeria pertusa]|uniref:Uncharacterized protein n=1 Tax=Trematosphaeria pertusa TaxID=390896 RepID=A0A6A6I6T8_9PLEO|nr:uncharacterized protein BU26DRAFT_568222 [Trematosphaeria pertusa]KAF2245662.1 hypothetical protein BU26DRAFT_568222 [Trematosphaeria pertusa]
MATASPLLALPGEVRNLLYVFYFAHDPLVPPPHISRSPLALSLTCRQLYSETHALAFVATTFRARCWLLWELKTRFRRLSPPLRPSIKRLELTVHVSEFLRQPSSLQGLRFAEAGLTGLQDLYIQYTGQPKSESGETYIISNLELVLWKTVVQRRNDRLEKIRVVHGGALRWTSIIQLCERMHSWLPLPWVTDEVWETRRNLEEGRFSLVKRGRDGSEQRVVEILLGYTIREAEQYRAVREELLQGKVLENVRARRPKGEDAADLDSETLAYEIEQLSRDFRLPHKIDTSGYY